MRNTRNLIFLAVAIFFISAPMRAQGGYTSYPNQGSLRVTKEVRIVNRDNSWARHITVQPGDMLEFRILVWSEGGISLTQIIVTDQFDGSAMTYVDSSLAVNGSSHPPGLSSGGLTFTSVNQNPIIITYRARVTQPANAWRAAATAQSGQGNQASDEILVNVTNVYNTNGVNFNSQVNNNYPANNYPANSYYQYPSSYPIAPTTVSSANSPYPTNSSYSSNSESNGTYPSSYLISPNAGSSTTSAILFALLFTLGAAVILNVRKLWRFVVDATPKEFKRNFQPQ